MHLASIAILLLKIITTRSAQGISFKSQVLYAVVFAARYMDLFTHFVSIYNTLMKLIFIGTSLLILYLMKVQFKTSWDEKLDTFRIEYLILPCAVLSLLFHYQSRFNLMEILWAFSIYLEAVAIVPQLFQLTRTGEAETITSHYLFALGGYRALYLLNWTYRYFSERHFNDWIAVIAGLIQTALYADFFYVYVTKYF